jgi:hypothetical protein
MWFRQIDWREVTRGRKTPAATNSFISLGYSTNGRVRVLRASV